MADLVPRTQRDPLYGRAGLLRLALAEFPELREDFEFNEGLLHCQIGDFAAMTERAVRARDWGTFDRCVAIVNELGRWPDSYLRNAIYVSFLEHLPFDGSAGRDAWSRMTPQLQQGWKEIDAHNRHEWLRFPPSSKSIMVCAQ
jgi:hypothetical protein